MIVPRYLVIRSCCAGARWLEPEGWLHTYEMVMEQFVKI